MFTQDIFARNAVMVIGINADLMVIRGIRATLRKLTTKKVVPHPIGGDCHGTLGDPSIKQAILGPAKIIEHNPRKGIFFAQKYNIPYLLFIYFGFIISPSVISPSVIYNHKKREDTHMSSLISILSENAYLSILYIY
jgi:hypothetical protein